MGEALLSESLSLAIRAGLAKLILMKNNYITEMKSHISGVISKLNFVAICIKSLPLITVLK